MMSLQTASRAILMPSNVPRMLILSSASTMRVRVAFSMVNLVLPLCPAMRPMARDKWSPCRGFTSFTWKDSM